MEMALTYSSDDNEVKYYKTTKLNGVSVKISACTISGSSSGIDDRLNEDAFSLIINKGVLTAAVFDGFSIEGNFDWLYTTPARYASHYSKHALEKILGNTESEKLLMSVNDKLLKRV